MLVHRPSGDLEPTTQDILVDFRINLHFEWMQLSPLKDPVHGRMAYGTCVWQKGDANDRRCAVAEIAALSSPVAFLGMILYIYCGFKATIGRSENQVANISGEISQEIASIHLFQYLNKLPCCVHCRYYRTGAAEVRCVPLSGAASNTFVILRYFSVLVK